MKGKGLRCHFARRRETAGGDGYLLNVPGGIERIRLIADLDGVPDAVNTGEPGAGNQGVTNHAVESRSCIADWLAARL